VLLRRLALLTTLAVGAGALVYNALSIVRGEGGLVRPAALFSMNGDGRIDPG
jgi:hypothetical protein